MIDRISKNEKYLDSALLSIDKLEVALALFKSNFDNIDLVNKYYGSKEWFKDKDAFESKKISDVKAGVLGEDTVWNMNESICDLISEMKEIISFFDEKNI